MVAVQRARSFFTSPRKNGERGRNAQAEDVMGVLTRSHDTRVLLCMGLFFDFLHDMPSRRRP